MSNKKKSVFVCGVDWQHEIGEASGGNKVYASIDEVKEDNPCWDSCGIVELEISFVKWHEPQDIWKNAVKFDDSKKSGAI